MNTQQLQTFVTLADTLNYHRAAEILQYSPSTLFKHIKLLEEEVGVSLMKKRGRNLELTAEGQRMVMPARTILRYVEDSIRLVRGDTKAVTLNIGGSELSTGYADYALLHELTERYPSIRTAAVPSSDTSPLKLLAQGAVEAVFSYEDKPLPTPGIQVTPLYREPVCLLCSPDHPLAQQHSLTWEDIEGIPVVDSPETRTLVRALNERLVSCGVDPTLVTVDGMLQNAVQYVLQHNALLAAPWTALHRLRCDFGLVRLDIDEEPVRCWQVLRSREPVSPVSAQLTLYAKEYAARVIEEAPNGELTLAADDK